MDQTALAAALTAAIGIIAGFAEAVRRGALVPRFAWDREAKRGDLADERADKLEAANAAQTRAIEDLTKSNTVLVSSVATLSSSVAGLQVAVAGLEASVAALSQLVQQQRNDRRDDRSSPGVG